MKKTISELEDEEDKRVLEDFSKEIARRWSHID
jgi:hypothetical protein